MQNGKIATGTTGSGKVCLLGEVIKKHYESNKPSLVLGLVSPLENDLKYHHGGIAKIPWRALPYPTRNGKESEVS